MSCGGICCHAWASCCSTWLSCCLLPTTRNTTEEIWAQLHCSPLARVSAPSHVPPPSPPAPHQHPPCPLHPAPPTPLTLYSNAAQLIGPFPLPMQAAVPQWGITSDTGCFCLRAPGHNAAEPCVASSTHPQSPAQPPPGPAPGRPTAPAGHQAIALRTANLRHTGAVHSAE